MFQYYSKYTEYVHVFTNQFYIYILSKYVITINYEKLISKPRNIFCIL